MCWSRREHGCRETLKALKRNELVQMRRGNVSICVKLVCTLGFWMLTSVENFLCANAGQIVSTMTDTQLTFDHDDRLKKVKKKKFKQLQKKVHFKKWRHHEKSVIFTRWPILENFHSKWELSSAVTSSRWMEIMTTLLIQQIGRWIKQIWKCHFENLSETRNFLHTQQGLNGKDLVRFPTFIRCFPLEPPFDSFFWVSLFVPGQITFLWQI